MTSVPSDAQSGPVSIINSGYAQSNSLSLTVANPTITSLSPTTAVAGQQLTITGTNFGASAGRVMFGSESEYGITSWTDTQIVTSVPSDAQSGPVSIINSGYAQSNSLSLTVVYPNITGLSPTLVVAGQQLTITGTNFGSSKGRVMFGSESEYGIPSWADTQIVTSVPPDAQSGPVSIITSGYAQSNSLSLTVTPAPTISGLAPSSGSAGTSVIIAGANLWNAQESTTVTFNGVAVSPTSWSSDGTSITAAAPAGVVTCYVLVAVNGVASNAAIFRAPTSNFTLTSGSLATPRGFPTATVLTSGQVLVAGGLDINWNGLAGEALYDPVAQSFTATTGNLNTGRGLATATLLDSGKVLITGGWDSGQDVLSSAEIYDPAAGTLSTLSAAMTAARYGHAALLLGNGNVLIVGGFDVNGYPLASAESLRPQRASLPLREP